MERIHLEAQRTVLVWSSGESAVKIIKGSKNSTRQLRLHRVLVLWSLRRSIWTTCPQRVAQTGCCPATITLAHLSVWTFGCRANLFVILRQLLGPPGDLNLKPGVLWECSVSLESTHAEPWWLSHHKKFSYITLVKTIWQDSFQLRWAAKFNPLSADRLESEQDEHQ